MNNNNYKISGWLALANAVILLPAIGLGIFLDYAARTFTGANLIQVLLSILFCSLGVYILWSFRHLLNFRYRFNLIDRLITALIWINIIITVLGLYKYFIPESKVLQLIFGITVMALFYGMGVINIVLGVRLLKLNDDMFSLKKPFAYANIISGVCILSIILIPFGLLAAIVVYILQGIIFLRAAEDVEFV